MKKLLFLFFVIQVNIYSKKIYFCDQELRMEHQFSEGFRWGIIKNKLNDMGIECLDLTMDTPISDLLSNDTIKIVYFNLPAKMFYDLDISKFAYKNLLFLFEPPSVVPFYYAKDFLDKFNKICTWHDDMVDGKKFIKFYYFPLYSTSTANIDFNKKKFCTTVVSKKSSSHPSNLYAERINIIKYLDKNYPDDFDFYGTGKWSSLNLKTYRGTVEDKIKVVSGYKFCICYENMTSIKGYVTEKIFNAFTAGSVPVYWGADNITDYVPKNCFIDKRDFKSNKELCDFMYNMTEETYNTYIYNIKNYLKSKEAYFFTEDYFVEYFVNTVLDI